MLTGYLHPNHLHLNYQIGRSECSQTIIIHFLLILFLHCLQGLYDELVIFKPLNLKAIQYFDLLMHLLIMKTHPIRLYQLILKNSLFNYFIITIICQKNF